ncbi:Uu.00g107940.m01.CDS01 [Anthostomella pinea]|uniref:Uu.00g107940.m01.CDS01 n=1 Tax=Anthostomella pinea TaxID=933095 RepID=A0AAI8VEH4_9PEZI|nr:Uu.00g107940.m01.CDS01 [Anthostomella pinea]
MALLQITKTVASLAACVLLASPALAMPVETRQAISPRGTGKRMLLWPYTNTQEVESGSCKTLSTTAQQLASSSQISMVSNWETWQPKEVPTDLPFSPTVKDQAHLSGNGWTGLQSVISAKSNVIVQFYNEPNLNGIDATTAAQDWKDHMVPLRNNNKGLKLVTPACTSDPSSKAWMDSFMGALGDDEQPDYIGLHYYTTSTNPVKFELDYAQGFIESGYKDYGNSKIPVMITEMSSTSRDPAQVQQFIEQMSTYLDGKDWVHAYGFTGVSTAVADSFSSPAAQLLSSDGTLNALGKMVAGI